MKKIILSLFALFALVATGAAQNWDRNNSNGNGYYMGPGMMWNDGYGYGCYGPGMMWGNWGDRDWHRRTQSNLGLNNDQVSRWNRVTERGEVDQKAVNDSIQYFVNQIRRLQKNKSDRVQQDLGRIQQILTPQQYTQFLQELVTKK